MQMRLILFSLFLFSFPPFSYRCYSKLKIHFADGRRLFRIAERYRWGSGRYTCGAEQRIGLKNRLIKMLIARLVRRPPATSARSSARGRLAGSLWVFAFKLSFFFSLFSPFLFFPPFRSIIYRPMARIRASTESGLYSLARFLDRRELTTS